MGIVKGIDGIKFPQQSERLGKRVDVCDPASLETLLHGEIVRDDTDYPNVTIIKTEDDSFILGSEHVYSLRIDQ